MRGCEILWKNRGKFHAGYHLKEFIRTGHLLAA